MSKTTKSLLASLLLGSAFGLLPAGSMAKAYPVHAGFKHSLLERFAGHRAERDAPLHKPAANTAGQKPVRLDSGDYTIIDHPNTDASWGTRTVGINESSVLSGYYLNKDDGAFHAYLLPTKGGDPTDIQVGHNDTFGTLLNDQNETFGTYIDADTGVKTPGFAPRMER